MRRGDAHGEGDAAGETRRVVRLLVLLGAAVAVYLALSLFDHAAHADSGSLGQTISDVGGSDQVASVKATATGVTKAVPKPSAPKSIVPKVRSKAHSAASHRPAVKLPEVRAPKI